MGVDIGFEQDATFKTAPGRFAVGDEIVGLELHAINRKKNRPQVRIIADTRLKSRKPEERAKRETASSSDSKDVPSAAKSKRSTNDFSKSAGAPSSEERAEGWKEAAAPRPVGGWQHAGG